MPADRAERVQLPRMPGGEEVTSAANSRRTPVGRPFKPVGIGPVPRGGFGLIAALDLEAPQVSRDVAVDLMSRGHEMCPYSRATRGNIEVTLTVGGAAIERRAA